MRLTTTQIKVLKAIWRGRGQMCLRSYRFSSAAVLDRNRLIEGDRMTPYWMWHLTGEGRKVLRLARRASQ